MKKVLLALLVLLAPAAASAQEEVLQEVTIEAGDTMWSIANKYLKDPRRWPEIVKHNDLPTSDPTIALPGTRLKIPVLLIKEEFQNAQLVKMIPEVRYRRRGEDQWHEAKPDMTLKYEDSLRTMKGAQARVRFPTKEIVQINENSYVVLKPEKILQEIQLLRGDVRASRARVIMPGGTVVKPSGNASDYQAKVRDDNTEVVFVYKGEVNVTARGQTVRVREGFGTQVPKEAPPMKPMPLSSFKDFDPAELTTAAPDRPKVDPKTLQVTPPATARPPAGESKGRSRSLVSDNILTHYRLQLARDKEFTNIVLEKTEATGTTFEIRKESVPDGTYFMRVAFIDALGNQGKFSVPNSVTKDTKPPEITNVTPANGQQFVGDESYCDVIGTVEGAAVVTVNDVVVFLSQTGRFSRFINLKEGVNEIRVVARDVTGNETSVIRKVTYRK